MNGPLLAGQLLSGVLPEGTGEERFEDLIRQPGLRIERIVSTGQSSPPGFWYDQPEGEWVLLLVGQARLLIEGEDHPRALKAGDWIDLPPHCRHRVEWTDPECRTIWLAVHYSPPVDRV